MNYDALKDIHFPAMMPLLNHIIPQNYVSQWEICGKCRIYSEVTFENVNIARIQTEATSKSCRTPDTE